MTMNKSVDYIKELNKIEWILLLSPFIDLLTSIGINVLNIPSIGLILRSAFLVCVLLKSVFNDSEKNIDSFIYYFIFLLYLIIFVIVNLTYKNISLVASDIAILIKSFYFPLLLVSLSRNKDKVKDEIFVITALMYAILIFVPQVLGIGFQSYEHLKKGTVGLFNSPNEIGAIVAILSPIYISYMLKKRKFIYYLLIIFYLFVALQIGTKVPLLAILISLLLGVYLEYFKNGSEKKETNSKKTKVILLVIPISVVIGILLLNSSAFKNILVHVNFVSDKDISLFKKIKNLVLSSRDIYNNWMINKLHLFGTKERLFGLGHNDPFGLFGRFQNIVEIDYLDIFYMFGIVGFIIYFIPLLISLVLIYKKFGENENKHGNISLYFSILLGLFIALFAGHVFTAPSVSLMMVVLINKVLFIEDTKLIEKDIIGSNTKQMIISTSFVLAATVVGVLILMTVLVKPSNNYYKVNDGLIHSEAKTTHFVDKIDENIDETEYVFDLDENVKVVYTVRNITDESQIKFVTISNESEHKTMIRFDHNIINGISKSKPFSFKPFEFDKEHDATVGVDKTGLPSMYAEKDSSSYLLSKTYEYNLLQQEYSHGLSEVKELVQSYSMNTLGKNDLSVVVTLDPGHCVDYYFINSDTKLLATEEEKNQYINIMSNQNVFGWMDANSTLHKLPYSIEPFTLEGYGRNPGSTVPKHFLRDFEGTNNEISNVYLKNSVFSILYRMKKDKTDTVWLSEYTNTCLKDDYRIAAPYIDSRHNETLGNFLRSYGDLTGSDKIYKESLGYANYLVEASKKSDNFNHFSDGKLLVDYFEDVAQDSDPTHSSLNHVIANINYLYSSYFIAGEESYLQLADQQLETIVNQNQKWIFKNSDLYYQVSPNEKFEKKDYVYLTLTDLLILQDNLKELNRDYNLVVQNLIDSKVDYLIRNNIPIDKNITNDIERIRKGMSEVNN